MILLINNTHMENTPSNGKKILLTEDDKFFRDLLTHKLTVAGFEVTSVSDGESAITTLETFAPDIAILDILLPGMNGFDILSKIRKNEKIKDLPVIFLSNLSSRDDILKGKVLGVTTFLIKASVTPDEVIAEVKKILNIK